MEESEFLCPKCIYGSFFRTVKNIDGIPYDVEYRCNYQEMTGSTGLPSYIKDSCTCFQHNEKV